MPGDERPIFQRLDTSKPYPYTRGEYARRLAWEWVQRLLIRPSPRRAYAWRRFWFRLFGATIPPTSGTRPDTVVFHPWLLTLGQYTIVGERVTLYNLGPIVLGDHTVVSQDAYLCAGTHDYTKADLPLLREPVTVGSGVWVCAGAFIGPGVTVGNNAVVGARAVVVKDVPPNTVVAGNPARVVKQRPTPPR